MLSSSDGSIMHMCRKPSGADLKFMHKLLQQIEADNTPASELIEERYDTVS